MPATPRRFAWLFWVGARVGIQGLPALLWGQIRYKATMRKRHFLHTALDGDGIGGTFLRADLASHAGRHLHGCQHHPGTGCRVTWDGREQFIGLCSFPFPPSACHVQAAHPAKGPTNTTINTPELIDLKPIGHAHLLSGI